MKLMHIDPLKLQALQTFVDALLEILRVTLRHPLSGSGSYLTALCRDDESFRIWIKRLGNEQFISFRSVGVRRVDQIHSKLDRTSQNFDGILALRRPTPDPLSR